MSDLLPAAQRLDLRKVTVDNVLSRVEASLQLELSAEGSVRKRRSLGFRSNRRTWVRIECRGMERFDGQGWGLEAAQILDGVPVPTWHAGISWLDVERSVMWRADETALVEQTPVGRAVHAPALPGSWWTQFNTAMDRLTGHATSRLATPDCEPITVERVEAAIRKVFPDAPDIRIDEWTTAHADLNWANMTGPDLWILDWEDFGRAPRGLDAANLWFGSLAVPEIVEKVYNGRRQDMDSRTGQVMQLFKCAELLAWADDSESLFAPAQREAARLRALLVERP
jgi:hypothetical protein